MLNIYVPNHQVPVQDGVGGHGAEHGLRRGQVHGPRQHRDQDHRGTDGEDQQVQQLSQLRGESTFVIEECSGKSG